MALLEKTKAFVFKCRRVWHVLKKPSKNEFVTIAKVSAMGIGLLGVLGFFISLLMKAFF